MAKTRQIRILKSLWGKFNLPYTVGGDFKVETKLAGELIREGFAMSTTEAKKLDALQGDEAAEDQEDPETE